MWTWIAWVRLTEISVGHLCRALPLRRSTVRPNPTFFSVAVTAAEKWAVSGLAPVRLGYVPWASLREPRGERRQLTPAVIRGMHETSNADWWDARVMPLSLWGAVASLCSAWRRKVEPKEGKPTSESYREPNSDLSCEVDCFLSKIASVVICASDTCRRLHNLLISMKFQIMKWSKECLRRVFPRGCAPSVLKSADGVHRSLCHVSMSVLHEFRFLTLLFLFFSRKLLH